MAQITSGVRNILSFPWIYNFVQRFLGADKLRSVYVGRYICPVNAKKILDIGCGTSEILSFISNNAEYVGYDLSERYIASARAKYGDRGVWHCAPVSEMDAANLGTFDLVMANGIFHHLNDTEATHLIDVASKALKPSGRFVSLDCCFTPGQSRISRFIVSKDRGQNIRTPERYAELVRNSFCSVDVNVHHELLKVPYTHVILVATKQ